MLQFDGGLGVAASAGTDAGGDRVGRPAARGTMPVPRGMSTSPLSDGEGEDKFLTAPLSVGFVTAMEE